ncbi:hypothetical protein HK103_003064, partial [Boothiomyces macroporosus]
GIYDLTKVGNSAAAVDWAIDANLFDCSKVWGPVDADPKQDFGGKYYQDVYSTAEKQIAKGGYRLAHLLNEIFQDCQIPGQPAPATTTQAPTQAPGYTSAAPQTTTAAKGYQGNGPAAATTTATYGSKPIYSSALASSVSVLAVVAFVFAL